MNQKIVGVVVEMSPDMNEYKRDGSWGRGHTDSSPSLGFAAKRNRGIRGICRAVWSLVVRGMGYGDKWRGCLR